MLGSHHDENPEGNVMATESYRERMKAARAEARAKREAEKAAWKRRVELIATARMMALDVVKDTIRGRGDKVSRYTHAQLRAQADEMMGPWMILKAKERIAARRTVHSLRQSVDTSPANREISQ
jgi:hypothetical protein